MKQRSGKYFLWIMLAAALGVSGSFQSCLNDSAEDCDDPVPPPVAVDSVRKVRVFFDYEETALSTSAASFDDSLAIEKGIRLRDLEAVSQLDLYVFSAETGLFIEKYTDLQPLLLRKATYSMELELPIDKYKIVAWGGMRKSDFAVAPVTPVKKSSHFDDFFVNYHFQGDTILSQIENLYYGAIQEAAFATSDSFRIYLRQDTYTFNIKLVGTAVRQPGISSVTIHTVISDNNSTYNFNNVPVSGPTHSYKTLFEQNNDGDWDASRTTLLVDEYRRPVLRFFRNGDVWRLPGMSEGIDLINLLQQYATAKRILLDFSTMYVFNLRFTINGDPDDESSMSVGVEIGDWNYIVDDNELYR